MRGLLKLYMANYLFVTAREALQGCRQKVPPCALVPGNPSDVFFWDILRGLFPSSAAEAGSIIYGWYTGLVYFTPFFGGILADRWLGRRKTVMLGCLLMAAGHFVMASEQAFFLALLLMGIGAAAGGSVAGVPGAFGGAAAAPLAMILIARANGLRPLAAGAITAVAIVVIVFGGCLMMLSGTSFH